MKEQARWLSEIWGKVAEGERLERLHYGRVVPMSGCFPGPDSDPIDWRTVKPKPKIVDLTPLVNSGVWCELWNAEVYERTPKRGFLASANGDTDAPYIDDHDSEFFHCRPLLNHWNVIEGGGQIPGLEGVVVDIDHTGHNHSTIQYTGLQEGWSWP